MKRNKKIILIMTLILLTIPTTKIYGTEEDKYTCDNSEYEVVSDSKGYYCCPKGFSYGYLGIEGMDDAVCYYQQDLSKEIANTCKAGSLPASDNSFRCYTEPAAAKMKSSDGKTYACFSCKNYNKYVYSNKTPSSDDCPTEWEILKVDEKSCKEKEKSTSTSSSTESTDGVYMILQCAGDDGYPFFAEYLTDNKGNPYRAILNSKYSQNHNIDAFQRTQLCPSCWLNSIVGELNDLKCNNEANIYSEENAKMFELGICPEGFRESKYLFDGHAVPYGKQTPIRTSKLDSNKFIIYSYTYKNETKIIVEAYTVKGTIKGRYGYIGGNLVKSGDDEIVYQQEQIFKYLYNTDGSLDFFNIDNKFATLQIAGNGNDDKDIAVCKGLTLEQCANEKDFKILVVSGDGTNLNAQNATIGSLINKFFTSSGQEGLAEIKNVFEKNKPNEDVLENSDFIAACKDVNEKMNKKGNYKEGNYSIDEIITNLEYATKLIDELYDKSDTIFNGKTLSTATAEWIMQETTGTKELLDLRFKKGKEYSLNAANKNSVVYTSFIGLINENLAKESDTNLYGLNLLSLQDDLDKFGSLFYETVNNLLSGQIQLTISQEDRLQEIQKTWDVIAEERDYTYTVTDCEGLLSQNFIEKMNSYLNIVKYAVPILLIALGIFDFSKAVLSSSEDEMKKSQSTFIKRLVIALLFFLVPTIVNLILTLANKVWPIIIPNSCEITNKD